MSSLPVILVSAKTVADADYIISQLLQAEAAAEDGEGESEEQGVAGAGGARLWRLANKYYRATVELRPAPDGAPPPHPAPEGHLLYLTHDEVSVDGGVAAAERRTACGAGAGVRVLAADTARLDAALLAWAARRRLEPVPLRAEGAASVRAALHAHPWRGLRRRAREAACDEDAWAAALTSLAPAAAAARALEGPERLAAAESVLAAFCRAIGEDMDDL